MEEKTARYITTTLPYVNSDPHIGHALEFVQADALARAWRAEGHEVFFNTGTDEHGQKIAEKADEAGQARQAYVDRYAAEFKRLGGALNLSFDRFIRTTDQDHQAAAQEMWRRCAANRNEAGESDIYKKNYQGLYCVGCELYYDEDELDEGRLCKIHGKPVAAVAEENYFFRLSRYQAYLEEYLARPGVVVPEHRREEALAFVCRGLKDFSISRRRERLNWGVPVPDDDEHVMYVWFDALTNYISTLGWPEDREGKFAKFWSQGEVVQVAGKDQVRFQSVMWQAMLKSAGVKASDAVVYHGFITSGGQKMSKSLGNVISPYELTARYGADATRYLLLRHVHPFEDTDITWARLDEWYTANLVNGLGNLTARVLKMAETHLDRPLADPREKPVEIENYHLSAALDAVWERIKKLDERITATAPFKLIKTEPDKARGLIEEMRAELLLIARLLLPFMPATGGLIEGAVKANRNPEHLFKRLDVPNTPA
jgi:methionyl-tRNA synthetase